MTKVIFIGLSNKVNKAPLSSDTLSGKLIDRIILRVDSKCIKANLVDFAPIDSNGKLRYPTEKEKNKGYKNLIKLINDNSPCVAVCLGNNVANFLEIKITNKIKIKHPSYMSIYKRSEIEKYIENSVSDINSKLLDIKMSK